MLVLLRIDHFRSNLCRLSVNLRTVGTPESSTQYIYPRLYDLGHEDQYYIYIYFEKYKCLHYCISRTSSKTEDNKENTYRSPIRRCSSTSFDSRQGRPLFFQSARLEPMNEIHEILVRNSRSCEADGDDYITALVFDTCSLEITRSKTSVVNSLDFILDIITFSSLSFRRCSLNFYLAVWSHSENSISQLTALYTPFCFNFFFSSLQCCLLYF